MSISIAEQITAARKAAGMTQDELASALHVTRSAVSSWERGRTEPDLDTLRQMAQLLNCSFTTDDTEPAANKPSVKQPPKSSRKTGWIIGIAALAVLLTVCAVLFVVPAIQRRAKEAKLPPAVKVAVEDLLLAAPEEPTTDWFQQGNVRAEGEPWLEITTSVTCDTESYSEPFWRYQAAFKEATGRRFTMEYVEHYVFWQQNDNTQGYAMESADGNELMVDDNILDYWEYNGGMPVQELLGIGFRAVGHDEANHSMSFRTYIDLTAAPRE